MKTLTLCKHEVTASTNYQPDFYHKPRVNRLLLVVRQISFFTVPNPANKVPTQKQTMFQEPEMNWYDTRTRPRWLQPNYTKPHGNIFWTHQVTASIQPMLQSVWFYSTLTPTKGSWNLAQRNRSSLMDRNRTCSRGLEPDG